MTQEEFEARIGHQVTDEEFETFKEVYMNCEMGQEGFCKAIKYDDPQATEELIFDLSDSVRYYRESRNALLDKVKEAGEQIAKMAHEKDDADLRALARRMLGRLDYSILCLNKEYTLASSDIEYIVNHLKED